jgi:hypothetical protein
LLVDVTDDTTLSYHFHQGPENASTYPAESLMSGLIDLRAGTAQLIRLPVHCKIRRPGWHFLILDENTNVRVHVKEAPPGQLRYYPRPEDPIRPNPFSTWTLRSLPIGQHRATDADGAAVIAPQWNAHALQLRDQSPFLGFSYACEVLPAQHLYGPENVTNPCSRPTNLPNLWVSADTDFSTPETLTLTWDRPRSVTAVQILFDSALHFHFSQSWQGYAATAIPTIVRDYRVIAINAAGTESVVTEVRDNHQRNVSHPCSFEDVVAMRLECLSTYGLTRAQVYAFRVFEP